MTSRTTRLVLVGLLLVSLLFRSPLLFFLDVLLALVAGASALWGRYCLAGVTYLRRFGAPRLFCGEETDLWLEITNAKPLPLPWLKTEDEFPVQFTVHQQELAHAGKTNRRLLNTFLSLRWYERVRRHYRLTARHRGVFEFGPLLISSGDLFGFRIRSQTVEYTQALTVYPRLLPLTAEPLAAARPLGDFKTARRVLEDPLRLAGAREYRPGDSLRHVHWKATARRAALQTKVFDPSAARQLLIGVNAQTMERAHQGVVSDVFELTAVVAAAVAHAGLQAGLAVGLFTNGGVRESPGRVRLPAARRPDQLTRILETLAQLTYFTLMPFEKLLHLEASQLPFGATIIAISPLAREPILSGLLDLRAGGHPVALIAVGRAAPPAPPELPVYAVEGDWRTMEQISLATGDRPLTADAVVRPGWPAAAARA
jgi:uncharacterized protein (DUF58 family)